MPNWKQALLAGSAGAAVIMFLKGKPLEAVSRLGERLAQAAERRGSAWYEGLLEG